MKIEFTKHEINYIREKMGEHCTTTAQSIINKLPKNTYKLGDQFVLDNPDDISDGKVFTLHSVGAFPHRMSLMCDGECYAPGCAKVADPREVTREELEAMTDHRFDLFKKI